MVMKASKRSFGPVFCLVRENRTGHVLCSSVDVFNAYKDDAQADREWLQAIYLDPKNQVITEALEALGTIDSSAVYPREIARRALMVAASAVILIHNHPSGEPDPSLCDREITRDVCLGLSLLQIKLLDHVIIGARINDDQRFFSFADQGLIDDYSMSAPFRS